MVDQDGRTAIHSNLRISSRERERVRCPKLLPAHPTSPVRTFVTPRAQPANGDDAFPFPCKGIILKLKEEKYNLV